MRDPRVFGLLEDHPPRDDSSDGQPHPMSETTLAADAVNRYGSLLRDIQTSDLAKCSCLRVLPSAHFSQSMPLRRLSLELKHFLTDHLSYITVAPIEDNLCNLLCSIEGPPGTPYEKGIFFIRLDCPDDYPVKPPVCNFITQIYHPNISQGRICVNILEKAWCPALTIESILLSICSLLADPFFDDPLDDEVAAQYNRDKRVYESIARLWTQKYATGKKPTQEELDVASEWNKRLAVTLEKSRTARRRWDQDKRGSEARTYGLW